MNIIDQLLSQRFIKRFILVTKEIKPPGLGGLPLYEVAYFFIKGLQKGSINTRASSLSFKFFLAIFPAILFFFTLIAYIPIPNVKEEILLVLKDAMPDNAFELTISTITDILQHKRGGLLSFSFILALYFAANGVNAMLAAFNDTYHTLKTRSIIGRQLISLALTMLLVSLVVASSILMIVNDLMVAKMSQLEWITQYEKYLIQAGRWIIQIGLMFFAFSFIYYYALKEKSKWKFFSPGSTLATILSAIATLIFSYYVNNFSQHNKLYGSIGTIIIIMIWIHFHSLILLIGFELNASIKTAWGRT